VHGELNALRLNDLGGVTNDWGDDELAVSASDLGDTDLQDGGWHHVAATFDGVNRSVWVDGFVRGSDQPDAASLSVVGAHFRIGWQRDEEKSFSFFKGEVDDVAVFQLALTASQMAAVMGGDFSEWGVAESEDTSAWSDHRCEEDEPEEEEADQKEEAVEDLGLGEGGDDAPLEDCARRECLSEFNSCAVSHQRVPPTVRQFQRFCHPLDECVKRLCWFYHPQLRLENSLVAAG